MKKIRKWFEKSQLINDKNLDVLINLSNGSLGKAIELINNVNPKKLPEISNKTRIGACVSNPQKFIGMLDGKNHGKTIIQLF